MNRKKKFLKVIVAMSTLFVVVGTVGCSNTTNNKKVEGTLESSNVTLITKITPGGEVGYAVVCDYGSNVDASSLSEDSFLVESTVGETTEPRTITKVYTNDSVAISDSSKEGRYVVIELDPKDANASTLTFTMETFLNTRNDLKYTVTQKTDITTSDNTTFKASGNKIANGDEVRPVVDDFKKETYTDASGNSLNYRFFEPQTEGDEKYPLVIFLHGSGERGTDNGLQLEGNMGAVVWATPEQQVKNPTYVLAPQAPVGDVLNAYWVIEPTYEMVVNLVKETIEKYPIDPNRIYVTGMSNGGVGTWNIVKKNPDLFAAAVPICGAVNVTQEEAVKAFVPPLYYPVDSSDVEILKNIPIWAFTAADDTLVDVRNSREITEAIRAAGGDLINYTEYPAEQGIGHGSWVPAYQDQEMIDWLFKQSKNN